MDFITGLPPSRGYTAIMVVVDRLSKYAHFAPLPTRFDVLRVTHLFINTIVRHHGFPKTLVSDRDAVFFNNTWEEMLRLSAQSFIFLWPIIHNPMAKQRSVIEVWSNIYGLSLRIGLRHGVISFLGWI